MGFKYRKSYKIAPGVKLNVGKKSTGISVGNKGGGVSFNSRTGARMRASIPGTGISYTSKLGSKKTAKSSTKKTSGKQAAANQTTKKPVPQRGWFIGLAILCSISGIIYLSTDVIIGILTAAIGILMLVFTAKSPKISQSDNTLINRHLKIFDESVKLFMSTDNPETFFGRYRDAERAAKAMAEITDAPICHNEPPQNAVEMLSRDKTAATNAFLDRYSQKVKLAAFNLTRGRKQKIESFKLITGEYESMMTRESIYYRDTLYADMLKKIEQPVC